MKKLLLSVAALALCFAAPAFSVSTGAASADAYVKDCGVALPPVIAAEYSAGVADAAEPPASKEAPPAAPACLQPGRRGARSCDFCFDYSSKRGIRKGILFLS